MTRAMRMDALIQVIPSWPRIGDNRLTCPTNARSSDSAAAVAPEANLRSASISRERSGCLWYFVSTPAAVTSRSIAKI